MTKGRWITPNETGDSNIARCLSVPEFLQPAVNGALQDLTFADNWEQVGDLTPEECAAAMVDVLSTYYESEDCSNVDTPTQQTVLWIDGKENVGNVLQLNILATQVMNQYWRQQSPAINDEMLFNILLAEGTYDLTIVGRRDNGSGVQHWIIDGTEDGDTIEMYAAAAADNYTATISVAVLFSGLHAIKCKISSKNGSSSNYRNNMTYFKMIRTGD